jgi:16S rRNA (guanine(1405)-N(7))-methyltransferase
MNKEEKNSFMSSNQGKINNKTLIRIQNLYSKDSSKEINDKRNQTIHIITKSFRPKKVRWAKVLSNYKISKNKSIALENILKIHNSTHERLYFYEELYKEIFSFTGKVNSINDLACGLNPISQVLMNLSPATNYFGSDIDIEIVNFLNDLLPLLHIDNSWKIENKDIIDDNILPADLTFLFKIIPLLKYQSKISLQELLRRIQSNYIVLSFPTKSLSGEIFGMSEFYYKSFIIPVLDSMRLIKKISFVNEEFYIMERL